ncbi:ABC transporter G family member 22 [Diplonema papillatum]|nr:ABC transporter G family member 22 [Diplonema papillatum]
MPGGKSRSVHSAAFQSCVSGSAFDDDADGPEDPSGDEGDDDGKLRSPSGDQELLCATWARQSMSQAPPGTRTVTIVQPPDDSSDPGVITQTVCRLRQPPATIAFNDLNLSTPSGSRILQGISGVLFPGKITAVLGSDEGETTALLTLLAGEPEDSACMQSLYYNKRRVGPWYRRKVVGFVRMRGVFFSRALTVRQNLVIALQLHLNLSRAEESHTVDRVLEITDLLLSQNECISRLDAVARFRLTVAQELLLDPSVIVVESPTTGLSYTASLSAMKLLRFLAVDMGKTVVVSLNQPRWAVYNFVDTLLLIHGGRLAYFGKASESAIEFFQSRGLVWNRSYTPTDFLLQLCSQNEDGWPTTAESPEMDAATLASIFIQSPQYKEDLVPYLQSAVFEAANTSHLPGGGFPAEDRSKQASEMRRLYVLLKSQVLRTWSARVLNVLRFLLFGVVVVVVTKLNEMQSGQRGLQNRVGIAFLTVVLLMLVNAPHCLSFIRHRPVCPFPQAKISRIVGNRQQRNTHKYTYCHYSTHTNILYLKGIFTTTVTRRL